MVNPLDRNFFKFLFGFVCILAVSFSVLYLVNEFSGAIDQQASAINR